MTELEELEDIVGCLDYIEPFGIEPDFSSLGIEPAEILGFKTEEELELALLHLTMEVKHCQTCIEINIDKYKKKYEITKKIKV